MATAARSRSRPARESGMKPRNDAYTGLLFSSFLALAVSSILLFLDKNQYGANTPPKLNIPALGQSPVPGVPGAPAVPDAAPGPGADSTGPAAPGPAAPGPGVPPAGLTPAAPAGPPTPPPPGGAPPKGPTGT